MYKTKTTYGTVPLVISSKWYVLVRELKPNRHWKKIVIYAIDFHLCTVYSFGTWYRRSTWYRRWAHGGKIAGRNMGAARPFRVCIIVNRLFPFHLFFFASISVVSRPRSNCIRLGQSRIEFLAAFWCSFCGISCACSATFRSSCKICYIWPRFVRRELRSW